MINQIINEINNKNNLAQAQDDISINKNSKKLININLEQKPNPESKKNLNEFNFQIHISNNIEPLNPLNSRDLNINQKQKDQEDINQKALKENFGNFPLEENKENFNENNFLKGIKNILSKKKFNSNNNNLNKAKPNALDGKGKFQEFPKNFAGNYFLTKEKFLESRLKKEKRIIEKIKSNNLFGLNYLEFILKDKYKFAKNIECNRYNCFSPNICFDGKFCKCGEEYANYAEGENKVFSRDYIFCSYKRKKQIITFMLEFFLFFGIGHIYAGNFIIGVSKLIFFLIIIIYKLKTKNPKKEVSDEEDESPKKKINWLHLIILMFAVIWYLVDIIFLALSRYSDGNGIPMLSW